MNLIRLLLLVLLTVNVSYAGRLMDTDFASEAELNSRGASKQQLLNTSKIYDTAKDDTLNNILDQGTAVTDDLYDLVGVPAGDTDLGSFTGTTIPDASTVKGALQSLETFSEDLSDDFSLLNSDVVKLFGDQTVNGIKTFSGKIKSTATANGNMPCPSMTQAQIDVLTGEEVGDCVFNTTTGNLNVFDGTIWKSAGGGLSMWESGKVFNLNDVVVYDNAIYRCISAHTSIASFEPANWVLISGDTILNDTHAKKIEADKVIQTANNTLKIETDSDNLLVNGGFEAQDVTLGWTKSVNTSIDFIDVGAFEGKKSRSIRFGGTVANYRAEANRPEYVGRQARAEIYYRSPITWGAEVPDICVYAGTASNVVSGTCEKLQNTGTQWYPYQKGFFWSEAVMGLVIRNNGAIDLINYVYLDKASIKLDKNEGFVANIEGDYQSETLLSVGNLTQTTNLASFSTADVKNSGSQIYTKSTAGITLLRDAYIDVTYFIGLASGSGVITNITFLNGVLYGGNGSATAYRHASGISKFLKKGDVITFEGSGNTATYSKVTISAKARSQVTVFPDETFSTDINPVYWKATACGETEIGCYNTFVYDSSNNRTMCGTRPTPQTDADIRINGFRVYTRNHNVASSCATPVAFRVMMPKNLSNPSETLFKDTTRAVVGGLDLWGAQGTASMYGAASKNYNPSTGTYDFDSGEPLTSTVNAALFRFIDRSTQNNGYLVIKASKTGLGMANVPAMYPVYVTPPGTINSFIIYSNGWVRQVVKASTNGLQTLPIAMYDTNYSVVAGGLYSSASEWNPGSCSPSSTTSINNQKQQTAYNFCVTEGYGASSVVKQYGANPAY